MRNPEPRKWITWEIPNKYLEGTTDKKLDKLAEHLREEVTKALEDMIEGIPTTFKITNLPRDW